MMISGGERRGAEGSGGDVVICNISIFLVASTRKVLNVRTMSTIHIIHTIRTIRTVRTVRPHTNRERKQIKSINR